MSTITVINRRPIMTMADIENIYWRQCALDLDEVEAKSHKYFFELLHAVNVRDVILSVEDFKGKPYPLQSSAKAQTEIWIPSLDLCCCEILRIYDKDGHCHVRFREYGVSETSWFGWPIILAARKGLWQECRIKTSFRQLIPIQRPMYTEDAISTRWSTVYYGTRSRTISTRFRLLLSAMPTHFPFGGEKVVLKDPNDTVSSTCEWISGAERQRRQAIERAKSFGA